MQLNPEKREENMTVIEDDYADIDTVMEELMIEFNTNTSAKTNEKIISDSDEEYTDIANALKESSINSNKMSNTNQLHQEISAKCWNELEKHNKLVSKCKIFSNFFISKYKSYLCFIHYKSYNHNHNTK